MGKAARLRANSRKRKPGGDQKVLWIAGVVVAALAIAGLVAWLGNGSGAGDGDGGPVSISHVHGLGVNDADGALFVATHDGVYRIADGEATRRVGEGRQDTMGFTVAGPDRFLASGHPAPGQGGPRHLGLIESADAGVSWQNLSLAGDADFHALRFRHGFVYGYNSVRGQLLTSTDKVNWENRSTLPMRDFEVSPSDPDTLLATTDSGVQRSADGGRTWAPAGGPPVALLAWEAEDRLWGVTAGGDVLRSADGGSGWDTSGRLPGPATAFAAHNNTLYASVHDRGIYRSTDAGQTWDNLHS